MSNDQTLYPRIIKNQGPLSFLSLILQILDACLYYTSNFGYCCSPVATKITYHYKSFAECVCKPFLSQLSKYQENKNEHDTKRFITY